MPLGASDAYELPGRAESLHLLVTWIAAIAESIELQSAATADLGPHLETIIAETELISGLRGGAAA